MKTLIWLGDSLSVLRTFPAPVQDEVGYALYVAQWGQTHRHAKPLRGLGGGVMEIVSNDASGTYRAVYTVSLGDAIYVVHAFQKKSKSGIATPKNEIDLVRRRIRDLKNEVAMLKKQTLKKQVSSGNIFADLGLPDAGEHLIKAGLAVKIEAIIKRRGLTQTAAARAMGIDQPKVSAMLAGQLRGYSVERMMRFLVALGQDVEIVVKPRKRRAAELRVA
jgi:phage-related protein/predicted XRE-type DNA-binding protein